MRKMNQNKILGVALVATLFLFLLTFTSAVTVEQIPLTNVHVNDYVGVLSAEQKNSLETQIAQIENQTTVEIAIAIIGSTDGRDIASFAFELGNKWKIGKTDVFNGVLILIAIEDREWFIATAKGIEGTIPDLIANRVGETNFPQNFRNNDYYSGLSSAISDLGSYIAKDPTIVSKYNSLSDENNSPPFDSLISSILEFAFVLVFIFPFIFGSIIRKNKIKGIGVLLIFDVVFVAFFFYFNIILGVFAIILVGVITIFSIVYGLIPAKDWVVFGGRGGGFGGFGGGSFGGGHSFGGGGGFSGGGAGGRW